MVRPVLDFLVLQLPIRRSRGQENRTPIGLENWTPIGDHPVLGFLVPHLPIRMFRRLPEKSLRRLMSLRRPTEELGECLSFIAASLVRGDSWAVRVTAFTYSSLLRCSPPVGISVLLSDTLCPRCSTIPQQVLICLLAGNVTV